MDAAAPEPEARTRAIPEDGYRAVVLGSTGAIGRELVAELVQEPRCGAVVAVTRRAVAEADYGSAFPSLPEGADTSKLTIAVVDFDKMVEASQTLPGDADAAYAHKEVFAGAHFVACCLGASPFNEKADLIYPAAGVKYAAAAGVTQYSLVTSAGASHTSWVSYLKMKGQQEEDAKEGGFPRLTIFRPVGPASGFPPCVWCLLGRVSGAMGALPSGR